MSFQTSQTDVLMSLPSDSFPARLHLAIQYIVWVVREIASVCVIQNSRSRVEPNGFAYCLIFFSPANVTGMVDYFIIITFDCESSAVIKL